MYLIKPQEVLIGYIHDNYKAELKELNKCGHQTVLKIDYILFDDYFTSKVNKHLFDFDNYRKIITDVEKEINKDNTYKDWISIKIVDYPPNCQLHDLDASHRGDVISTKALIKNITEPAPTLKTAVYECRSCMRLYRVNVSDNIVNEPSLCSECGGRSFRPMYDLSDFRDYRLVKLEEPLEYRTGGNTREFKAYMEDYLASPHHTLKAGDVVDIIGDFKVQKTDKQNKKHDFEFIIDLHNINPVNNAFEDYTITEDDREQILELSKQPDIYKRLVNTLAPEIVGYEDVKEGLLLQLFEGYRPADDTFKNDYMDRWTSHILIIGDPGIGKSQLVTALKQRVPRMIYINGADTTQAGLTTSAVKDELTGSWTLEAGATILADTGVLCIDEFDKLSKQTMKSLNQPMEQLSVSSTKAGLVQTMSARTSIIACANPKYSRFNPYKSIKEQINIPESTLSRFDLVFALKDNVEEERDTMIATALLNTRENVDVEVLDTELFKKYITYAKLEVFPVLTDDAKELLINFYVNTRQSAINDDTSKPITARDLKAVERLTIARAKTELRDLATVDDARCAINIYCKSLESIGLTPETRGELENVLSDAEIKLVNDTELMIKAEMEQNNIKRVNKEVIDNVKHEVGVLCYGLGFNRDIILEEAIRNVKSKLR